jgi:hypothetical protein
MTTVRPPAQLRVAVDTSVLFPRASLDRLLATAAAGLVTPIWSAQVAAELARTLLWQGKLDEGRRSITVEEYHDYRRRVYERIDRIDLRCEIVRVSPTAPTSEGVAWAAERDVDDLHVQLLARAGRADCVVSLNHRDFPARQVVGGAPRGELCGIIWITPDELPAPQRPAPEAAP